MKKIAVFDVDGTLSDFRLGVELLKELSGLGAIRGVSKDAFQRQYDEWALAADKTAYYDSYLDGYYDSGLVGTDKSVFQEAGARIAAHAFPHFYQEVLAKLEKHQRDGRFIILISKSPEQAIAKIAELVNADAYWGWQFNFDANNKYVDQYTYPSGESDKAYIINQLATKHHLSLDDSYTYGDSAGDISMLHLVAHPTAVNPEPKLLGEALANGWDILETTKV